jgi:Ni/Co efflux regulator RcnB
MKKIAILLFALVVVAGLAAPATVAQEQAGKKEKVAAAAKQARWHGIIQRMSTEESYLDVRKGNITKRIHFDSSTRWTEGKTTAEMSKFKEGDDVICLGTYDEKGNIQATRIDLRTQ